MFRKRRKYEDRFDSLDKSLNTLQNSVQATRDLMLVLQGRLDWINKRLAEIEGQNQRKLVTIQLPDYDNELEEIRKEIGELTIKLSKKEDDCRDVPFPSVEGTHDDKGIQSC